MENKSTTKTKIQKRCLHCKKKLSLVDKTINNCSGCNKKYCIKCIQRETHECTNENKPELEISGYEKIAPSKLEHI